MLAAAVFAVSVAACAPRVQPVDDVVEAVPTSSHSASPIREFHMPLRSWIPEKEGKAVLVALHGFNDYSNAFDLPARHFAAQGIITYAYDQRGFGESAQRGIWGGTENLTRDVVRMLNKVRQHHPGKPVYLLGESMGAAVAFAATARSDFPQIDGLIVVAPAVWGGETMSGFYRSVLWLLAHTMPGEILTGKDLKIKASDNIGMLRGMGRDPKVIKKTRIDTVYGMVQLMDVALANIPHVKAPVLLLYGEKDQVIPRGPVIQASKRLTSEHTVAVYPAGYHMLLRDHAGKVVQQDIVQWIYSRRLASGVGAFKTQ